MGRRQTLETRKKQSLKSKLFWKNISKVDLRKRRLKASKTQLTKYIENLLNSDFDSLPYQSKRNRVILEQQGKCFRCKRKTWMKTSLIFEIDHVNGENSDDRRSNLVALCPNCHSLTPTWRGKKNGVRNNKVIRILSGPGI